MGFNVGDILDKIISYEKILEEYNYVNKGSGNKAWSIQHVKENSSIEIRNSEWTYYENEHEIKTGTSPETLKLFLEEVKGNVWISVKDRLPVIPKGRYGVPVLVATFDPNQGYEVRDCSFGNVKGKKMFGDQTGNDFMEMYIGGSEGTTWGPTGDPVTHWMYLPKPPKINKEDNNES